MGFLLRKLREQFEEDKPAALQADIRMISGCDDSQTSADVSDVGSFQLPDPAGRAGGACTSTLLQILYKDEHKREEDLSFTQVLEAMRDILQSGGYTQIPQLSASQPIDVNTKFDLVPPNATGTSRAVMIGINYVGHQPGQLSGCHNDVNNMIKYIKDVHGFRDENITILMDDGIHTSPTQENILQAYRNLVASSQPGDTLFCHYSGHGGKVPDTTSDEKDGYDETLVPVDFKENGQIRDDVLYEILVQPMQKDMSLVCIFDCCHSGSIMDLPYVFRAGFSAMEIDEHFNFKKLLRKCGHIAKDLILKELRG